MKENINYLETKDIQSDLHTHTNWSDGNGTIRQMVDQARQIGLHALAITDHSLHAPGLSIERLREQKQEIDSVRSDLNNGFRLLWGAEVEILPDGQLDYPDDVLAGLDIVVASLHSNLDQPREIITQRLLKVIRNPHVDIIAHPSGRYIPEGKKGADLDWEVVFQAAQEHGVALEINSSPNHLDMDEKHARQAAARGTLISLNTDSHTPQHLIDRPRNGLEIARNAWIEPEQVINTWSPPVLLDWLKQRGHGGLMS